MKRRVVITCDSVRIEATIDASGHGELASSEVREIRDELTDRLMRAAADLPYLHSRLHEVRVK